MSLKTAAVAGASAEKQAEERRAATRYRCCRKCNVRPAGSTGVGTWPGIIYNISTAGIGVVLPCPLIAGTHLIIELFGGKKDLRVEARVARSVLHTFAFFHGCEFLEPLDDHEVRGWLK